mgnify:CR=1 FL=1
MASSPAIYLIESLPEDEETPFERSYVIMGNSGKTYTVTIAHKPRCTCPDFKSRSSRCKHIFFVLIRIMNIANFKDRTYSEEELTAMFKNIPEVAKNLIYQGELPVQQEEVNQKFDKDDVCPICLDPLENGKELDYCKYSCGKTIHKKCFSMWEKSKGGICVFCRGQWYSDFPKIRPKKVSMHPIVETKVDEENKSAVVVVKDDSLSLAIGRKGVNARLAVKLTGYNIDIKVETEALEAGIEYVSFEEISALALEERAARIAQAQREALVYQNSDVLPSVPDGYVAPQARQYEEESNDFDSALEEALDKEEVVAPEVEEKVEEVALEVEEVAPALEEPAPEVEEKVEEVEVKTTTTLEDLEKSLSDSKKETNKKSNASKRKKKVEEEEEKDVKLHSDSPRMSIYTEEELREMEEEENDESYDEDEDDIDYDEYDEYYDEN